MSVYNMIESKTKVQNNSKSDGIDNSNVLKIQ
jgi:hypothetical protein